MVEDAKPEKAVGNGTEEKVLCKNLVTKTSMQRIGIRFLAKKERIRKMTIPEFVGYTGVALLIITYAMLQLDKIDPKGFWYSFNNLLVAILVTVSLIETPNKPSMVIEFFWFMISAYGITMFYKRKNESN